MRIVSLTHPVRGRLGAAAVAGAVAGVLLVSAGLVPRARHLGTHQQLGLPPCGFVTMTGLPCPTCGMTTAFAHAVRGQFGQALRAQPFGFLLAIATAGLGLVALAAVVTRRRPAVNWYRVDAAGLVWWVTGLLIASWAVKMLVGFVDGSLPLR